VAEIQSYRDLIAWQKAMALAQAVYRWTSDMSPDERFGLTAQMRRAAVSIPSNIAEGYARNSRDDYVRFLRVARGSAAELMTQAELAVLLGLKASADDIMPAAQETDRILNGLITSLRS
jgi:four helix bundle protein